GVAAMPPFSRSRGSMMKWLRRGMGMHCASGWASGCGSSIYLVPGTFCCWNSRKPSCRQCPSFLASGPPSDRSLDKRKRAMKNLAEITTHIVQTPSGRIAYAEAGSGPVALFVHGVLLNKHLWRHQMADLADIRRVIAVDLLAHGETEIAPDQDVSVTANANMLREFLGALKIDKVDLIGNDSGGGISPIFRDHKTERGG